MMYKMSGYLFDILLIAIWWASSNRIIKRRIRLKRYWIWNTFWVALMLIFIVKPLSFRMENVLLTFPSPEAAYRYRHSGNIQLIVEGEKTDFIFAMEKENTGRSMILPKSSSGWKLEDGWRKKRTERFFPNGIFITVYQYKGTDDYYLKLSCRFPEITDNHDSNFLCVETPIIVQGEIFDRHYTYYAYIESLDDDYTIIVDGEEFKIKDSKSTWFWQ